MAEKELARDVRDILMLLTSALSIIALDSPDGGRELHHISAELTRLLGRLERREALD